MTERERREVRVRIRERAENDIHGRGARPN
jgi:hypothetical protein